MCAAIKEPRSAVVIEHTRLAFRHTSLDETQLTADIVEHYLEHVDPRWRTVRFHLGGDVFKDMRANCQIIRRFKTGDVRFPSDIEESWIAALPQPYRADLRTALLRRIGRLNVVMPHKGLKGMTADTGHLCKEVGDTLTALAPVLSDGKINGDDLPHAQTAIRELDDLLGAVYTMRQSLQNLVSADRYPGHMTGTAHL